MQHFKAHCNIMLQQRKQCIITNCDQLARISVQEVKKYILFMTYCILSFWTLTPAQLSILKHYLEYRGSHAVWWRTLIGLVCVTKTAWCYIESLLQSKTEVLKTVPTKHFLYAKSNSTIRQMLITSWAEPERVKFNFCDIFSACL